MPIIIRIFHAIIPVLFILLPIEGEKYQWRAGEALFFTLFNAGFWVFLFCMLIALSALYLFLSSVFDFNSENGFGLSLVSVILLVGSASLNLLGSYPYGGITLFTMYASFYLFSFIYLYLIVTNWRRKTTAETIDT